MIRNYLNYLITALLFCFVLLFHILFCYFIFCSVISYFVLLFHILFCYFMLCFVGSSMLCYFMFCLPACVSKHESASFTAR